MFDRKEEITEAVEALYEVASGLDRGEILTHDQIIEVLGIQPHAGRWDHIVGRVRRRVRDERGIATWFKRGIGYELLTKAGQLELPRLRTKKAMRQFHKSRLETTALPEKGLTLNERRLRTAMLERLTDAERAARDELKAQSTLLKPSYVHPRRPVPVG